MTPTVIPLAQVHIGDLLQFDRDGYSIRGVIHDVDPDRGLFFGIAWVDATGATLTLLDRAKPPVPDTEGTVVQHVDDPTRLYVRWHDTWVGVLDGDPDLSDPAMWKVLT